MNPLYKEWQIAADTLKAVRKEELRLRNILCQELLKDKLEGAVTVKEDGLKLTATAKITRSLDKQILEAIWEDLTDRERECIDYTPKIKLALYRPIEETGGKLMDAITVKPAQATLKLEKEA